MYGLYKKRCKTPIDYAEIVKGLTEGLSIAQQYKKFGVDNPSRYATHVQSIRKKIIRVYNVDFVINGIGKEPTDPDFVRMHVDDGTFWDILDLIQKTEIKN